MVAERVGESGSCLEELLQQEQRVWSLDAQYGNKEGDTLYKFVANPNGGHPESRVLSEDLRVRLDATLDTLDDQEAKVLRLYFGIGRRLNLTRERVRQVRNKALTGLRHPAEKAALRALMD